jgi:hypothetical protein
MEESEETERNGSSVSVEDSREEDSRNFDNRGRGRGIKSSWHGGKQSTRERGQGPETVGEEPEHVEDLGASERGLSENSSASGKGRMVDIGLDSVIDDENDDPPDDLAVEMADDEPPAFQQFRPGPKAGPIRLTDDTKIFEGVRDLEAGTSRASMETTPPNIPTLIGEPPKHDLFWGSVYLIGLASLFATFFLVFLHTSTPSSKLPLGDTIYTALRSSFHLLAVDTVVAVIVSLVWLALLRSFVRPLVYLIMLSVPIILISFSLYPLVSSFKGTTQGNGFQDRVMRWMSFIPGICAALWLYTVYKARHSLSKAIGILEFSSKILAANSALLPLGFAVLISVILWTWVWLGMFTRVFLGGHFTSSLFIIDFSTWWLGVFFVLMYLWTLSIIAGIQRATTAATVSQWYFHRNAIPATSSRDVVLSAFTHGSTILFGTICLSTLLALLIRLPILVLPKRIMGLVSIFAYSLIPSPIAALINPLTLTYAAIQSQPLHISARALSQMTFLGPSAPTTTLTPRAFSSRSAAAPLLPYRLAKLLLHTTRFIMAISLGFGGWVATARQLDVAMPGGKGVRGSAYAYIVGMVAGFIGWGVLGAIEGVLAGIVDAGVICWGIEKGGEGGQGGSYCVEAAILFGEGRDVDGR